MRISVSPQLPTWLLALATAGALALPLAARAGTNSAQFGFTGPEFYPLDPGISQLHAADLDGDGLIDLIVVNNARSKINLLYNQTGHTNLAPQPAAAGPRDMNELPPDARFRLDSIASEKRISSLVVADLNGDGRPDLAYYGEPKELVVLYNQGTNGWSTPKRWPIDDGQLNPNALATGDLNGDHRTDLLLLGENCLYLLKQGADRTLQEPERIPYSGSVKSIQILDINGDGRDDLLLVNWESPNPFRFRLQNNRGQLGPEIHFSLPPIRSYLADDLNGDHKTEVVTIALNSGRVNLANFTQKPAEPWAGDFHQGQFQVLPLKKTGKAKRGTVWADLTGRQHSDLLVAEPDSGQITLYRQEPDGTLGAAQTFPSLTGISDLAVGDWNGDGRPEIFMLSSDERQVGVTHLEPGGRIPFPTLLPLDGTPLALAVGPLQPGARPSLALILDQDGKRLLQIRSADGKVKSQKLSDNFKSNPVSMTLVDADQDGLADLVVLIPYEKVKILRQVPNKNFEELDIAPPGGGSDQPWLSTADIDGDGKPELLLAEKNFVRAVVLQAENPATGLTNKLDWMLKVKEQINGAASNSRIVGAAPLAKGTNRVASLFLL
ncbi:MAG: VCBS repeat-containing protein, partial [Verrucomicrobia bacterium]|nr:VCBS repeat-containing protein [Verrucomicrobiota bacterium]